MSALLAPRPPLPIVVTGFGPFGGCPTNPSMQLVKNLLALRQTSTQQYQIMETAILETSVEGAKELHRLQQDFPKAVFHVHLGVHGGAKEFHVEHQAYNQNDFRIPDNNGIQLKNCKIAEECPSIYQSSINVPELVHTLGAGYRVSNDPGRFLCNHVFFQSLRWCATCAGDKHCLFIHIPPFRVVPEQQQMDLLVALLNEVCGKFSSYAQGPPVAMDRTVTQNETFQASVDVGNVGNVGNDLGKKKGQGEQKNDNDNDPVIPTAVLDFGFSRAQVLQAMSMLPTNVRQDPQRIVECIMNMGTSLNEREYTSAVDAFKMVILVRKDLKMGVGKIAAQCCHAAVGACRRNTYKDWENQGEAKIVLAVKDLNELRKYCQLARGAGLPCYEVQDAVSGFWRSVVVNLVFVIDFYFLYFSLLKFPGPH